LTEIDPTELDTIVESLRNQTERFCFACGPDNPIGLHLDGFALDGDSVTAVFHSRREHQGTSGHLHGGIAATVIDEIMVWAGVIQERVLCVTGRLELRYRRPLANSGTYTARASVDRRSGRRLEISGEILTDGLPAVTGSGLYLVAEPVELG